MVIVFTEYVLLTYERRPDISWMFYYFEGLWLISSNNQNQNQKGITMLPNTATYTNMQGTRITLLHVQGL